MDAFNSVLRFLSGGDEGEGTLPHYKESDDEQGATRVRVTLKEAAAAAATSHRPTGALLEGAGSPPATTTEKMKAALGNSLRRLTESDAAVSAASTKMSGYILSPESLAGEELLLPSLPHGGEKEEGEGKNIPSFPNPFWLEPEVEADPHYDEETGFFQEVDESAYRPPPRTTLDVRALRMKQTKESLPSLVLPLTCPQYLSVSNHLMVAALERARSSKGTVSLLPSEIDTLFFSKEDPAFKVAGTYLSKEKGGQHVFYQCEVDASAWNDQVLTLRLGDVLCDENRIGFVPVKDCMGWITEFFLSVKCSWREPTEWRLQGVEGASDWCVYQPLADPAIVTLPDSPVQEVSPPGQEKQPPEPTVTGEIDFVEKCDVTTGQWAPMSYQEAPDSLPMYAHLRPSPSLMTQSAYPPEAFVLKRSAGWGLFVANRPRSYFSQTVCSPHGRPQYTMVRHTVETEILVSTLLTSRWPLSKSHLLAALRCVVANCTREHYVFLTSLWEELINLVEPYLKAHTLEVVRLQGRLFNGLSWNEMSQARKASLPQESLGLPLRFFLKFHVEYCSFSEGNGGLAYHQWVPDRSSSSSSSSSPT